MRRVRGWQRLLRKCPIEQCRVVLIATTLRPWLVTHCTQQYRLHGSNGNVSVLVRSLGTPCGRWDDRVGRLELTSTEALAVPIVSQCKKDLPLTSHLACPDCVFDLLRCCAHEPCGVHDRRSATTDHVYQHSPCVFGTPRSCTHTARRTSPRQTTSICTSSRVRRHLTSGHSLFLKGGPCE